VLLIVVLAAGLLASCGGGGDKASSSSDPNQLLKDTFSGKKDIKSGKLDFAASVTSGSSQAVNVKVSGPFESQGTGRLPKLAIDASFDGGGQSIQAGVTSTGDKGFVSFGGTDYALSGPTSQLAFSCWNVGPESA